MISELAAAIRGDDRRALARAITLIEFDPPRSSRRGRGSDRSDPAADRQGERIGISGPPGAGKSTFIERFGLEGLALGHSIAVLTVDPCVEARRRRHPRRQDADDRIGAGAGGLCPALPAGESRGGVARRTREAILLCEAAGFDTVLVETIGAGQAETAVAEMVDMFVLILPPAAGDELQGLKRGIVELADLVLVNKADGDLAEAARRTAADYTNALRLIRPPLPEWPVRGPRHLGPEGTGIRESWDDIFHLRMALQQSGAWSRRRAEQSRAALWSEIGDSLLDHFRASAAVAPLLAQAEAAVTAGARTPPPPPANCWRRFWTRPERQPMRSSLALNGQSTLRQSTLPAAREAAGPSHSGGPGEVAFAPWE